MTKDMAAFRDAMTTRWTEQGRRIDYWYKSATKMFFFLGGGKVDMLPSDTRLIAPEVMWNPDYLHPSGIHPAFRETFKEMASAGDV